MGFSKEKLDEIEFAAILLDVASDFRTFKKRGVSNVTECPKCGGKDKLSIVKKENKFVAKCFVCDVSAASSINYLTTFEGKEFPEAVTYLADKYKIILDTAPILSAASRFKKKDKKSGLNNERLVLFSDQQLQSSGLTPQDVMAEVFIDEKTVKMVCPFEPGTIDQYNKITGGDDMLIWYFDLEGKQVYYTTERSQKEHKFYRVRWQVPANHLDKEGNEYKYKSPPGSGSHIYIPEMVRKLFKEERQFPTLYIDEGEKKAEKRCKHGMPTVGIQGIHNLAANGILSSVFNKLIKTCGVKNVVFCIDSDCFDISNKLKTGDKVDKRPLTFISAVDNFRKYFYAWNESGIHLELFFCHILPNDKGLKGSDDLLASMKNPEDLLKDTTSAMASKDGLGQFVNCYNITSWNYYQIREKWELNDPIRFAKKHFEELKVLYKFKIGKYEYRFDESGLPILDQEINDDDQFWAEELAEDRFGREKVTLKFNYGRCLNFLANRGYCRLMINVSEYEYTLAHIKNNIVRSVSGEEMCDYVLEFCLAIKRDDVREMLLRSASRYLGISAINRIAFRKVEFKTAGRDFQLMFFQTGFWKITAKDIQEESYNSLPGGVWFDQVRDFTPQLIPGGLIQFEKITPEFLSSTDEKTRVHYSDFVGQYKMTMTDAGNDCHFLKFLYLTSNFFWREEKPEMLQVMETQMHLLAKLCAIGYLLHNYINDSKSFAVLGLDGKMSVVGESHGRSGKSLVGKFIGTLIPQLYVDGKPKDLCADKFLWHGMDERTKSVFIDDVRKNFDYELLFPVITGPWSVNEKSGRKFIISSQNKAKIYLTSNHSIEGDSPSFIARQYPIVFSDFFNEIYQPEDEFGMLFFSDWDWHQQNLAYNLAATCIQLWLKFGDVRGPDRTIRLRRLRQTMGEDFLLWAESFYDPDALHNNFDMEIPREEVYGVFAQKNPTLAKYVLATTFKKKLRAFCEFKGYEFNPSATFKGQSTPGGDIKKNSIEFFEITNPNK